LLADSHRPGIAPAPGLRARADAVQRTAGRFPRGGPGYFSPVGGGGQGAGGAIHVVSGGTVDIEESTLSANQATGGNGGYSYGYRGGNCGDGVGAGIDVRASGTVSAQHSTLAANRAAGGRGGSGGISGADGRGVSGGLANQGALQARDSIVAGNSAPGGPDLSGGLGSQGYNLIGASGGGSGFDATDLLDLDPLLGPLQANGGPTQTMALLPASPAIDAGDNADAPEWDQRGPGFPRIVNGRIDIGAFEVQDGGGPRPVLGALYGVIARDSLGGTSVAPDAYGHTAAAPTGTARRTTDDEDPDVILPGGYPFTAEGAGSHASLGRATPVPPGDQALTATDLDELLAGRIALAVKLG
jgi:hypothetical protein